MIKKNNICEVNLKNQKSLNEQARRFQSILKFSDKIKSWKIFRIKVIRTKYLLNNNNFPIKLIEKYVGKFVSFKIKNLNIV